MMGLDNRWQGVCIGSAARGRATAQLPPIPQASVVARRQRGHDKNGCLRSSALRMMEFPIECAAGRG